MLKWSCALTLSCHFTYFSFASIGHADIIWSIVSSKCWQSQRLLYVSVFSTIIIIIIIISIIIIIIIIIIHRRIVRYSVSGIKKC
jgi:hypothetical protein